MHTPTHAQQKMQTMVIPSMRRDTVVRRASRAGIVRVGV